MNTDQDRINVFRRRFDRLPDPPQFHRRAKPPPSLESGDAPGASESALCGFCTASSADADPSRFALREAAAAERDEERDLRETVALLLETVQAVRGWLLTPAQEQRREDRWLLLNLLDAAVLETRDTLR